MMRRASVKRPQMNVGARRLRETLKKVFREFGLKITDAVRGDFCVDHAIRPAAEIYAHPAHHYTQGLLDAVPVADVVTARAKARSDTTVKGNASSRPDANET